MDRDPPEQKAEKRKRKASALLGQNLILGGNSLVGFGIVEGPVADSARGLFGLGGLAMVSKVSGWGLIPLNRGQHPAHLRFRAVTVLATVRNNRVP